MLLPPHAPLLHVARRGDAIDVTLTASNMGILNAEDVGIHLFALAEESGCRELRLDLGRVDFLSSTALAKFVRLHKQIQMRGGRLTLHNAGPLVYEVFAVTKLTTVLDVRRKA